MKKENLFKLIDRSDITYVSFDVFDTLLLRPFWTPADLLLFLNKKASELIHSSDVVNFSVIRKEAEKKTRQKAFQDGRQDITLDEIYEAIVNTSLFPRDICNILKQEEKDLELRYCYARKSALELLKYALDNGKKIIAVSDMYLPSEFIREILEKNGITAMDRIYVSGEIGKTKRSGDLYDHVIDDLHISPSEIIHIGDKLKVDVQTPRQHGWKAFPYYRPVDMLCNNIPGKRYGNVFTHSFKNNRAPQADFYSMEYLGLRCMLAVAANKVFDDPFTEVIRSGDFKGNIELFGTLTLGLYCLAHGIWMAQNAIETKADTALFFSRDGYLPYIAYQSLAQFVSIPFAQYAAISRRATIPLLLASKELVLTSGNHLRFDKQSPKTLVQLFKSVLKDQTEYSLMNEYSDGWDRPFSSETEMIIFLENMRLRNLDQNYMNATIEGFVKYYSSKLMSKTITYDVGYNIRNEVLLSYFFPNIDFISCFTHSSKDLPLMRSKLRGTQLRTFYSSAPYVSWLVREQFLTEASPSCAGYSIDGHVIYSDNNEINPFIIEMQKYAISFIDLFISIFEADTMWLPLCYQDACLPLETFLHSPCPADRKWLGKSYADDEVGSGEADFDIAKFWRSLRTNYWCASHSLGKYERYAVRFLMMAFTDHKKLKKRLKVHFRSHIMRK